MTVPSWIWSEPADAARARDSSAANAAARTRIASLPGGRGCRREASVFRVSFLPHFDHWIPIPGLP